jgi:hypothetical protein
VAAIEEKYPFDAGASTSKGSSKLGLVQVRIEDGVKGIGKWVCGELTREGTLTDYIALYTVFHFGYKDENHHQTMRTYLWLNGQAQEEEKEERT